jgi:hypothetical protein
MKATAWFRAQGQRMASLALPLQASPLWPHRNQMPTFAWRAFTQGYSSQRGA